MAHFAEKTLNGETYDLSHLDPFVFAVAFEERNYQTLVNFSCHCFTKKFNGAEHTPDIAYQHGGENRAFCVDRHLLSLNLPQHFTKISATSIYHTKQDSFFFIRSTTDLGASVPYVVFFRSYKSTQEGLDVVVDVSSAYPKPGMTTWASPVKFNRMIDARARGKVLPLGPARRIKRA